MIRVLVVEDQAMVRAGLVMILNAAPDITVVAEFDDGARAAAGYVDDEVDVCLVDVRLPGVNGIELTRRWASPPPRGHGTPTVVVTTFDDPEMTTAALRAGASGFLLKDSGPELLLEAIRGAASGGTVLSPTVASQMLLWRGIGPSQEDRTDWSMSAPRLTPREQEVARLVAKGQTNKEIAATLHISVSTVKLHLSRLQQKLGVSNRAAIAATVSRQVGLS